MKYPVNQQRSCLNLYMLINRTTPVKILKPIFSILLKASELRPENKSQLIVHFCYKMTC